MARNVKIQILRGVKANAPVLALGELYLATDTNEQIVGTAGGNLVLGLPVFSAAGVRQSKAHVVADKATLGAGGTIIVTLTGSAVFTSVTSYIVVAQDVTANHSCLVTQTSGSGFTITGTGGNIISFICVGT